MVVSSMPQRSQILDPAFFSVNTDSLPCEIRSVKPPSYNHLILEFNAAGIPKRHHDNIAHKKWQFNTTRHLFVIQLTQKNWLSHMFMTMPPILFQRLKMTQKRVSIAFLLSAGPKFGSFSGFYHFFFLMLNMSFKQVRKM